MPTNRDCSFEQSLFFCWVNYTIKCNTLRNKRSSYRSRVEWRYHTPDYGRETCMNYKHLSIEERSCIRKYYVDGLSYRKIAKLICLDVSTVSREIRRNCTHMYDIPTYYPHTAQKKYLLRRSYCHRGMFWNQPVVTYIEEKLRATWSPEQIACTPCDLTLPSQRTIYRWIYDKYLVHENLKARLVL